MHIETIIGASFSKYANLIRIFEVYGNIGVMFDIPKIMPIVWRLLEAIVKVDVDSDHVVAFFFVFDGQFWEFKEELLVNTENIAG